MLVNRGVFLTKALARTSKPLLNLMTQTSMFHQRLGLQATRLKVHGSIVQQARIVVAVSVKTTYGGNSYGGKGNRLLGGLNRLHSYNSVAFGKGKFVARRQTKPGRRVAKVSTDGNVWTDSNVAEGFDIATPDLYVNPEMPLF